MICFLMKHSQVKGKFKEAPGYTKSVRERKFSTWKKRP